MNDADVVIARSRRELKAAIESNATYIVLDDGQLAASVRIVKGASKATLAAAFVALTAGIAVVVINPTTSVLVGAGAGWGAAGAGAAAGSTASGGGSIALISAVAFLICVLGAGAIWAIFKNYDIIKISAELDIKLPSKYRIKITYMLVRKKKWQK